MICYFEDMRTQRSMIAHLTLSISLRLSREPSPTGRLNWRVRDQRKNSRLGSVKVMSGYGRHLRGGVTSVQPVSHGEAFVAYWGHVQPGLGRLRITRHVAYGAAFGAALTSASW